MNEREFTNLLSITQNKGKKKEVRVFTYKNN